MTREAKQLFAIGLLAVILIVLAVSVGLSATHAPPPTPQPLEPRIAVAPRPSAPPPPRLTSEQINRQDRVSAAQRRREARAFDSRPLLQHLPLKVDGLTIDIAGLAADGSRTRIAVTLGRRTAHQARATLQRVLRRAGDLGLAYKFEFQP